MKRILPLLALLGLLLAVTSLVQAESWTIDTGHSVLGFKVRHLFSKTSGQFDKWEGKMDFSPDAIKEGGVEIRIETASINTFNEGRDKHLRSADFFDSEKYPEILFVSTGIDETDEGLFLVGTLTMLGITKDVSIPFEFHGHGPDPWGGTRAGFSGTLTIDRTAFGLVYNAKLEAGGIVLGNEVEIDIEIEAMLNVETESD